MISDNIENISRYSEISIEAVDFIKNLKPDIDCGKYIINDNIYANVEIYNTKLAKDAKPEAHEKYVDIQILLSGIEKLEFTARNELKILEKYDKSRDIMFFEKSNKPMNSIYLDGTNFVMLYPNEAHSPQISPDNKCLTVKKVVVKCLV